MGSCTGKYEKNKTFIDLEPSLPQYITAGSRWMFVWCHPDKYNELSRLVDSVLK